MASLKGNVILNYVNTLMGIIYPVVTFPYAARVLMPDGIGAVNFLNSIVTYIVLFTSLGIPMYAVREVAKYRDDIKQRNKISIEITLLSVVLSIIGYVAVFLLAAFVPRVHEQAPLFYVLSLSILFTALGVQWFYQAIEDFKFITVRGIVVRTIAAVCLFIFVKSPNDLLIYGFIVVGSTVGNYLWNFIHLRKHISFSGLELRELNMLGHIGPAFKIFVLNLIISIYLNLNTIMLGFMQDDGAVGLYTAGNKISHILLTVIASLGVVMLPRCSYLVKEGKMEEFGQVTTKAMQLVFFTSLPAMIGLILLATPIMEVFCGKDFMPAVPVLIWTAPVILIIAVSNVVGIQILYPLGKENIVIWSTVGGAVINLLLNLMLIPTYSYIGAAISTLFAEAMVTVIQLLVGRKYMPIKISRKLWLPYLLATLAMTAAVLTVIALMGNTIISMIVSVLIGAMVYLGMLFVSRDETLGEILRFVHVKI